jgi:hypothetical protein
MGSSKFPCLDYLSKSGFNTVKNTLLQLGNILGFHIEIRAWIPVFSGFGIIVQNLPIWVVERTFQARTRTVFGVVLENSV